MSRFVRVSFSNIVIPPEVMDGHDRGGLSVLVMTWSELNFNSVAGRLLHFPAAYTNKEVIQSALDHATYAGVCVIDRWRQNADETWDFRVNWLTHYERPTDDWQHVAVVVLDVLTGRKTQKETVS